MHIQHAARPAEPLVRAAKIHAANAILAQERRAHDAWFDRDVEVRVREDVRGMGGEEGAQREVFTVGGALPLAVSSGVDGWMDGKKGKGEGGTDI